MDSLVLSSSVKQIAIERDGQSTGVISFNPSDPIFAEKFYRLMAELRAKVNEMEPQAQALDANQALDENNLPVNLGDRLAMIKDVCVYIRDRIDNLFGAGTSQIAFGDSLEMELFEQFLNGLTPFFQKARAEKIVKYTSPTSEKRNKRKVMK